MTPRRLLILVITATAVVTLTGCVPEPAPTPIPTGFASEEEAFAAAEETYRAYIDATNAADLEDVTTFQKSAEFTTGEARKGDQEAFSAMVDQELRVTGESDIVSLSSTSADRVEASWEVRLHVCLDVSEVDLTRPDGSSAVSPERPDVQNIAVTLISANQSRTGMLISAFGSGEDVAPCT